MRTVWRFPRRVNAVIVHEKATSLYVERRVRIQDLFGRYEIESDD